MARYPYLWTLKDANFTKDKGKVFSCFACGGGSTLGYKLAGFDVIGFNEIDPRMAKLYSHNHKPKYSFVEPIQTFKERQDLPPELYELDILDGSPPCTSFSIAGNREKDWGKAKYFKEGQAKQVLDTLFFDFIELARRLRPKVVVAENVPALAIGNAQRYLSRIIEDLEDAGYHVKHYILRGDKMGLPQARVRLFIIALRSNLSSSLVEPCGFWHLAPRLKLEFNEEPIPFSEIADYQGRELTGQVQRDLWERRIATDTSLEDVRMRVYNRTGCYSHRLAHASRPCPTITAHGDDIIHNDVPRYLSRNEIIKASSFPLDYDFLNQSPWYVCGMSVPPIMIANIAHEIYEQLLSKIQ